MRRSSSLVLAGLLLGALCCGVGPAATADELPPPAYPSGLPDPGDIGNDVPDGGYTPGPTIVITPGTTGIGLPQPTAGITVTPGIPPGDVPPGSTPTAASTEGGGVVVPGATPRPATPVADGGSPLWLGVAAGLVIALGLLAAFGGILQRRVTRDPASR